ncbi:hypothetical protein [Qiania dongpingensis]|uniref:Uncharacterized protein n=1 Tax=Qiania dongpingensis TaxID=2763669 RepID=A0A7G9G4R7_9FIRM|nr:hypothetical protein [Qiania dongpingensis]QNM05799.1 hypothetical protein H9Q78_01090 [Qiania dongpingensis]
MTHKAGVQIPKSVPRLFYPCSALTAKKSGQLKKELAAKRKELEQAKARQAELDNLIAATFEKLATGI